MSPETDQPMNSSSGNSPYSKANRQLASFMIAFIMFLYPLQLSVGSGLSLTHPMFHSQLDFSEIVLGSSDHPTVYFLSSHRINDDGFKL